MSGFRSALTRTLNRYAREKGQLKEKDENLTGEDIREGLTAVISVKLQDPQFEGQTKTKLGNPGMEGFVASVVNAKLAEFLEENPQRGGAGRPQGRLRRPGPRGRAQGARRHAQVRHGRHGPARQARRLHGQEPGAGGAVHRRGRLRRRLGQAGPRPLHPGRPAAARQDPQRREVAHRQGPAEPGDPGADHRARHRRPRRVRHREAALPQDHPDDGRRRGRRAHPHADPHAAVPRDAGADRGRPRLHRQAAAVQAHAGQARALHREGLRARGAAARRQARALRGRRPRGPAVQAHRHALAALHAPAQAVRGLGERAARRPRPRGRRRSSRSRRSSTTQVTHASTSCSRWSRREDPRPSRSRPSCVARDDGLVHVKAVERKIEHGAHAPHPHARSSRPTSTASSRACTPS